jgi:Spy/CpxP family protein refolding chaperone
MKRLVIILVLLIGSIPTLTAAAAGQEPTAPPAAPPAVPDQARQRLEQIKERLKLTPEQVEQVRPILSDEVQKLKALREANSGGSRRDRRKMAREFKRIQDEADDQLKKVLSKEQMNELKKLREERRQQLRDRAR